MLPWGLPPERTVSPAAIAAVGNPFTHQYRSTSSFEVSLAAKLTGPPVKAIDEKKRRWSESESQWR
jgi:hypothetical protein